MSLKGITQDTLAARQRRALEVFDMLKQFYGDPTWRNPLPALDELVSTILSQNTNDHNRDKAYLNLRTRFPTWESVRDASQEEVITTIHSAGLANQKGPRIQQVLHEISVERGCLDLDFLKEWDIDQARIWLQHFKGVGPKTAAIVLCFSLGKPAFPVDTHIYRVSGRLELRDAHLNVEKSHKYLEQVFPKESYSTAHLNLIRLGREVCHSNKPDCLACPLNQVCPTYLRNRASSR
jgi:endonuclease-3